MVNWPHVLDRVFTAVGIAIILADGPSPVLDPIGLAFMNAGRYLHATHEIKDYVDRIETDYMNSGYQVPTVPGVKYYV